MSGVRPLARGDLEQVAALYESLWRSRTRRPAPGLAPYFGRVFLDAPGIAPGTEALVYEAGGKVQGFIGVHVRKLRLDDEEGTLLCTGPLFTEPDARLAGALLLKAALDGPQLMTITDGATPDAVRLWEAARGRVQPLGAIRWTKILRPCRLASGHLARRARVGRLWRPVDLLLRPLLAAADAALRPRTPPPSLAGTDLDAKALAEGHRALAPHYRLRPEHDAAMCAYLLREARFSTDRGPLRGRLLRDGDGKVAGWYLHYAPRGGIARVLQVAAAPREHGRVLAHLFADADAAGVAAVQGRMETRLVEPLRAMGVRLHYDASMSLVHTRDPRVSAAMLSGDALLSRLEGEWFFSFQSHPLA